MPSSTPPSQPATAIDLGVPWQHRFAALGPDFSTPQSATPVNNPHWVDFSPALAETLGLAPHIGHCDAALQAFCGNQPVEGAQATASVYSGHQFGVWAGQLGDGRAILLGELAGHEIQLKGAGPTPYSRRGDGRAVLRSSIREFLCSEAMHHLGIPSSRALCLIGADTPVRRERVETAAIVTRVAPSFIRFGHFEHFAAAGRIPQLRTLADYVITHFYPDCQHQANPYAALLQAVTERTASLLAQWQAVGFCHGVMNTDNMSILGLTLDYGPFQFLDTYNPQHICNHSDHHGRYAFANQPDIAHWNLFCLGQALLPLIHDQDQALAALAVFPQRYGQAYLRAMAHKLGLEAPPAEGATLVTDLLALLAAQHVDYTVFWSRLSDWAEHRANSDRRVHDLFLDPAAYDRWHQRYLACITAQDPHTTYQRMAASNPRFVLRNYMAEQAIAAAQQGDFSVTRQLRQVLERPFAAHPQHKDWAGFPPDWAAKIEVSCSS